MAETVPRVSVQALRAFFTQHIEAALKKSRLDGEIERRRRQGRPLSVTPAAAGPAVEERRAATTDSASRMAKSASMGDLNRLLAKLRPVTKSRTGPKVATSTSSLSEVPLGLSDSGQKPVVQRIPRFSYHAMSDSHVTSPYDVSQSRTVDPAEQEGGSNKQKPLADEVARPPPTKGGSASTSPVTSSNSFHYQNTSVLSLPKHLSSMVTSDNYVSKAKLRFRKKQIPPKEEAGPPPVKPPKPPHVILTTCRNQRQLTFLHRQHTGLASSRPLSTSAPALTSKPSRIPPVPPTAPPCVGLRPFRPLPLPPGLSCRSASPRLLNGFSTARREVKSYSHDRLSKDDDNAEPLIPEYTEEEELGDSCLSLQDAGLPKDDFYYCVPPTLPPPLRPRKSVSSDGFGSRSTTSPDELYQDATSAGSEGLYEVVPGDCSEEEPTYGTKADVNHREQTFLRQRDVALSISLRKKLQIFHREDPKRLKKQREKRDKEFEKLRKKFGLTGEESPLDMGLVKNDSKGSRLDLSVKKGEPVLVLRMENNPSGRWLVRNDKGKIGYVELTNIEMDAESIKSVMAMRATLRSTGENDPFVDEEGIYEETLY